MEKLYPYFLEKPWAGKFLSDFYGFPSKKIGEAWLISTLDGAESQMNQQNLSEYLGKRLPFLVKIIDAQESLSVQVHPNDDWAQKLENSKGKTECWLIVNAAPGAGVYLGLRPGITEEAFKEAILQNKSVETFLNFYPVEEGDFISVPSGTIHAIGGGVTLLEVQQASGITYRLWDWGRLGRELHYEKGLKVSNYQAAYEIKKAQAGCLLKHSDFSCYFNEYSGKGWFIDLKTFEVYHSDKPQSHNYIFVR